MSKYLLLSALVATMAGCSASKSREAASTPDSTAHTVSSDPAASAPARAGASPTGRKKEGAANGTGCPKGSSQVTRDGNKVTFTFDQFDGDLSADKKVSVEDCNVAVPTPADKRVALAAFKLEGDLALERGAVAKLMFDSYLQGQPDKVIGSQGNYEGPSTAPLELSRDIEPDQRVWSECGATRVLNGVARLVLDADGEPGTGTSKARKLTLTLVEKPCSEG